MYTREYTYGNSIVVVYRPELTELEYEKVEKQILIGLQQIGKEMKENQNGNSYKSRDFREQ